MKFFACALAALSMIRIGAAAGPEDALPPEGQKAYALHSLLMNELAKEFPADIQRQVNDNQERLYSLTIFEGSIRLDGKAEFAIPKRVARTAPMFRYLRFAGELSGIEAARAGSPLRNLELTARTAKSIAFKTNKLPGSSGDLVFVFQGQGTIERVTLEDTKGLPVTFDFSPYRTLGADKPPMAVLLEMDLNRFRAIEGLCDLDRSRYFRTYTSPMRELPEHAAYVREMNFLPGRSIFKFGPALEEHSWAPNDPTLREDPNRPGFADLSFFDSYDNNACRGMKEMYGEEAFAQCFNNWPSFMSIDGRGGYRGTPKVELFDAAAELAAAYIRDQIRDSGCTYSHWEIKNESTVTENWGYHASDANSWDLLAEFHNKAADAIHAVDPAIKVGGPTSAWMKLEAGKEPFGLWRNQERFMNQTKGKLDFYSHHFYESGSACDIASERFADYDGYAAGKMAAELDMIANAMHMTNNVKPIVVSEFGALTGADTELGMWKNLKARNAYYFWFFEMPDRFDMVVPFTLGFMHWDKESWGGLFRLKDPSARIEDYEFELTRHSWLLEMWKDFRGKRLASSSNAPFLLSCALLDGKTLRLALHNLEGRRLDIRIGDLAKNAGRIEDASITSIYFENGLLKMRKNLPQDIAEPFSLGLEETAMATIVFSEPPRIERLVDERAFWGDQIVVKNEGRPVPVEIDLPLDALGGTISRAQLRLGFYREGGFDHPVSIESGGRRFEIDMSDTQGVANCFTTRTLDIPLNLLEHECRFSVEMADGDAWLLSSRVVLYVEK
ncbi:MAG: Beta-porphyranase A precursor [candidate division BRC1 bacterium ADurb.BinA364]|nr:MAG: Beta-porphyranase A precursor [candidate division BRC1 bacterium ADurb.BinA364]